MVASRNRCLETEITIILSRLPHEQVSLCPHQCFIGRYDMLSCIEGLRNVLLRWINSSITSITTSIDLSDKNGVYVRDKERSRYRPHLWRGHVANQYSLDVKCDLVFCLGLSRVCQQLVQHRAPRCQSLKLATPISILLINSGFIHFLVFGFSLYSCFCRFKRKSPALGRPKF